MVGVFKATIGLLMDEGRDWLAQKLKEGDVTDKFRDWIVRGINAMLMDAIAWKDLGASMNFFKEGLALMYKVLEKANDSEDSTVPEASMETLETKLDACPPSTAGQTMVYLAEGMKNFTLTDSDESKKEALMRKRDSRMPVRRQPRPSATQRCARRRAY